MQQSQATIGSMFKKQTKYIFITGGVCSSLGKGVTTAALGCLLENRGYQVALQKMDPYINIDPGTMNPFQHGEVYVTQDGAETDLDLGYYERFTQNTWLGAQNSVSTGQIYHTVIERERRGSYLGRTVQVIPHITNEIKERILSLAHAQDSSKAQVDFVIVEIGGTVGDIESIPFLEAIRQLRGDYGKKQVCFIHLTLIPQVTLGGEAKTKPSQHSVKELLSNGIQADIIICRTRDALSAEMRSKLSLFCNISSKNIIAAQDIQHSIYEIPNMYQNEGLDSIVGEHFELEDPHSKDFRFTRWDPILKLLRNPSNFIQIAICGKYIQLRDAYRSIYESLVHGALDNKLGVNFVHIDAEEIEHLDIDQYPHLKQVHGILIPGGFGDRGVEGKIAITEYARTHAIPFLGICLGMQCAVIEFARNVLNLKKAHSTEFEPHTPEPVISLLEEQHQIEHKGGTMRLGTYPCVIKKPSRAYHAYQEEEVQERHRHRFEFTLSYLERMEEKGLSVTGSSPDQQLVEIVELQEHPWFVGVQFHPEFQSKPTQAHPLFKGFTAAAKQLLKAGDKKAKRSAKSPSNSN